MRAPVAAASATAPAADARPRATPDEPTGVGSSRPYASRSPNPHTIHGRARRVVDRQRDGREVHTEAYRCAEGDAISRQPEHACRAARRGVVDRVEVLEEVGGGTDRLQGQRPEAPRIDQGYLGLNAHAQEARLILV